MSYELNQTMTYDKLDKNDPRTRQHFIKCINQHNSVVSVWECGICQREFKHLYMLRRHLASHTDERKYQCFICNKSFRQVATLNQHYSTHSQEKPYACNVKICFKAYNRASTLISHQRIHTDKKSFKCHLCSKAFHQKGNLRHHLFSHNNVRPYLCTVCLVGFNQQSNLVCHMKKVHSNEASLLFRDKKALNANAQPCTRMLSSSSNDVKAGIIIDLIINDYINSAFNTNEICFAVLKMRSFNVSIIKIIKIFTPQNKHMLLPVTESDLLKHGHISWIEDDNGETKCFFQLPITAILKFETISANQYIFEILSPITTYLPREELPNDLEEEKNLLSTNYISD